MILESIVTTINEDGSVNVSPMGPTVHGKLQNFELRPFDTSRTFANLKRTRSGVVHVTDDVGLIAQSAIGKLLPLPEFFPAEKVTGQVIANTCRWYEFEVEYIDENSARTSINCKTLHTGRIRDFWGFNRAKHAVIEAAILATRLDFLPREEIQEQFQRLETIVLKTGSAQESKAFQLLSEHVGHQTGENPSA
ncbi:MAG: DUF447 family protein [Mariniblastus sp.]|jgi:uncharacterized protein|nr:DUF447 family protein [Mariniblastus sp.]MDC0265568.1 DUF447 family protein [Mariniblastus sp.]MDG2180363.1 DUF447 family protein [Mariniblastus sp.]